MPDANPTAEIAAALSPLRGLLGSLTQGDTVTIADADGNTHTLRVTLPARRQLAVFREVRALLEVAQMPRGADGQPRLPEASAEAIVAFVVQLATDEPVAEAVGRAFAAAHPQLCEGRDPLDHFPMEDLVGAVVPVVLRFLRRTGEAILGPGA